MVILRLKRVLDGLINWSITNYLAQSDKTDSWLYKVFFPISTSNYNAYNSIVDILTRDDKNSRKLATRLLFDPSRADCPTIHIHLPQEEPMGGNLVGMSSDINSLTETDNGFSYNYRKYFSSNYDIIVTSNNQTEVLLIYELLKFLFIAGTDTINNNFTKFNYSGKELLYDSTLMPDIFFRAFSVHLDEDVNIPSIVSQNSVSGVNFDGYLVGTDTPPFDDYVVIFVVKNKNTLVVGAEIAINDTVLTTNSEGVAEITLNRQAYSYIVTKIGFFDRNGSVNVKGTVQVINVNVELSRNETHPGGENGQVQVNIDGDFAGFDSFTFDDQTEELSVNTILLKADHIPSRNNEVISKKYFEDNLPVGSSLWEIDGLMQIKPKNDKHIDASIVDNIPSNYDPAGSAAQALIDAKIYTDQQKNSVTYTLPSPATVVDVVVNIPENTPFTIAYYENETDDAAPVGVCVFRFNDNASPKVYNGSALSSGILFNKRADFTSFVFHGMIILGEIVGTRSYTARTPVTLAIVTDALSVASFGFGLTSITKISIIRSGSVVFPTGAKIVITW